LLSKAANAELKRGQHELNTEFYIDNLFSTEEIETRISNLEPFPLIVSLINNYFNGAERFEEADSTSHIEEISCTLWNHMINQCRT
jgi:hypothetical protein